MAVLTDSESSTDARISNAFSDSAQIEIQTAGKSRVAFSSQRCLDQCRELRGTDKDGDERAKGGNGSFGLRTVSLFAGTLSAKCIIAAGSGSGKLCRRRKQTAGDARPASGKGLGPCLNGQTCRDVRSQLQIAFSPSYRPAAMRLSAGSAIEKSRGNFTLGIRIRQRNGLSRRFS